MEYACTSHHVRHLRTQSQQTAGGSRHRSGGGWYTRCRVRCRPAVEAARHSASVPGDIELASSWHASVVLYVSMVPALCSARPASGKPVLNHCCVCLQHAMVAMLMDATVTLRIRKLSTFVGWFTRGTAAAWRCYSSVSHRASTSTAPPQPTLTQSAPLRISSCAHHVHTCAPGSHRSVGHN
jgi:hypothetical protein